MPTELNRLEKTPKISNQPVIQFINVGVCYRIPRERISTIKEYTIRWLQRRIRYEELWALKHVDFDIYSGEIFGVIGQNGAGKSTMLKAMARVLVPTEGHIKSRGLIAPLLELGAGFHPELTGRENVYLNGALLGRSRNEMEELYPWIVDFAELEHFMDAPIRTYSTGMQARLGFAVAVAKRPQILLVDELLSVGDTRFQYKCLERMNGFQKEGTTIVIVSHSMDTIRSFCKRALWLDHGRVLDIGPADEVVAAYQKAMQDQDTRLDGQISTPTEQEAQTSSEHLLYDVPKTHPAYPYLIAAINAGYEITYDGGYFAPEGILSRAQLAIFALRCKWGPKYEPRPASGEIYTDIPRDQWLSSYVEENYHFRLTTAPKGGKFWPEMGATRASAVYSIMKAVEPSESSTPNYKGVFPDVPSNYWAAPYIEKAVENGFITALDVKNNLFYPEEPISRADTVTMMVKALRIPI
ncbi:MAG TPA: ATP-binding cassette domain-containing protein [Anaerolineaceae bacterium]|nr:ATP-binding cassette domain-containing protein [Anaerolineaceae bacterium]